MYEKTSISIDKSYTKNNKNELVNSGVRQGCPILPTLFNIYMDAAICEWQTQLRQNFEINAITLNTILFADDQVVFAENENNLQVATFQLEKTMKTYNLPISTTKTKSIGIIGEKYPRRSKILIDGKIVEQV